MRKIKPGKPGRYIRLTTDYGGQRVLGLVEIMRHLLNQLPFIPEQIVGLEPSTTVHTGSRKTARALFSIGVISPRVGLDCQSPTGKLVLPLFNSQLS